MKRTNTPRRRIGLAVSGGADSVALLAIMAELQATHGFDAVVLHVDHGLRPESVSDYRLVKLLSQLFAIPFYALRTHVRRRRGESLEMAARRVRLAFFARMTATLHLDAIATGHHAGDVAETFLLRLARGAGPEGLSGLKPISHVNGVTFIRPLLNAYDEDLREFLSLRAIPWHEDATNADISIPRNNVRHVILPFLREHLDPYIEEHICKSAAILRGDLTRPPLAPEPPPALPPPSFTLSIKACKGFLRRPEAIGRFPCVCELDRAALAGRTLELRTWRPGDRIAPIGLGGHRRKLQDVFVTAKVPPAVRASLPLLADAATGEILWIPGYRVATTVAVTSIHAPSWRLTLACDPARPRGGAARKPAHPGA